MTSMASGQEFYGYLKEKNFAEASNMMEKDQKIDIDTTVLVGKLGNQLENMKEDFLVVKFTNWAKCLTTKPS